MKNRILAAVGLVLALFSAGPASAQYLTVSQCGAVARPAGWSVQGTVDTSGRICGTQSGATGSTGTDASANKPTLPNVGANFAASGPYASYVLVATKAANTARAAIDVENNSGAQIVIIFDDGTAANGAAPANASAMPLAGRSGVGSQGGSCQSTTEKGRIQVYAPSSSALVMVREN